MGPPPSPEAAGGSRLRMQDTGEGGRGGEGRKERGGEEHDPLYSKFEKMVHASQDISNTIILKDELQKILQLLRTEFN